MKKFSEYFWEAVFIVIVFGFFIALPLCFLYSVFMKYGWAGLFIIVALGGITLILAICLKVYDMKKIEGRNKDEDYLDDRTFWSAVKLYDKQNEIIEQEITEEMREFEKECYKKINKVIQGSPHLVNISYKEVSFYTVKGHVDEQWQILKDIKKELEEKQYYTWLRTSIEGHLVIGFQWRSTGDGWRT